METGAKKQRQQTQVLVFSQIVMEPQWLHYRMEQQNQPLLSMLNKRLRIKLIVRKHQKKFLNYVLDCLTVLERTSEEINLKH